MIPPVALLAAILLVAGGAGGAASAETLRVGGYGAVTELLPHLFAAFTPGEDMKLEVVRDLGSGGGLKALSEGVLDIAVSSRALKPEELSPAGQAAFQATGNILIAN